MSTTCEFRIELCFASEGNLRLFLEPLQKAFLFNDAGVLKNATNLKITEAQGATFLERLLPPPKNESVEACKNEWGTKWAKAHLLSLSNTCVTIEGISANQPPNIACVSLLETFPEISSLKLAYLNSTTQMCGVDAYERKPNSGMNEIQKTFDLFDIPETIKECKELAQAHPALKELLSYEMDNSLDPDE